MPKLEVSAQPPMSILEDFIKVHQEANCRLRARQAAIIDAIFTSSYSAGLDKIFETKYSASDVRDLLSLNDNSDLEITFASSGTSASTQNNCANVKALSQSEKCDEYDGRVGDEPSPATSESPCLRNNSNASNDGCQSRQGPRIRKINLGSTNFNASIEEERLKVLKRIRSRLQELRQVESAQAHPTEAGKSDDANIKSIQSETNSLKNEIQALDDGNFLTSDIPGGECGTNKYNTEDRKSIELTTHEKPCCQSELANELCRLKARMEQLAITIDVVPNRSRVVRVEPSKEEYATQPFEGAVNSALGSSFSPQKIEEFASCNLMEIEAVIHTDPLDRERVNLNANIDCANGQMQSLQVLNTQSTTRSRPHVPIASFPISVNPLCKLGMNGIHNDFDSRGGSFASARNPAASHRDLGRALCVAGPCGLFHFIRSLVSTNKRRFREDGFDLDLAYITSRIIAFGYPAQATWTERITRNHIYEGHAKIYNLVAEKNLAQYNIDLFRSSGISVTQEFSFFDHSVPTFEILHSAMNDMKKWHQADPLNVIAVHCKAGKGRTERSRFASAEECMDMYANARMLKGQGLTVPSQRRWVHYFFDGRARTGQIFFRKLLFKHGVFGNSFQGYRLRIWALHGSNRRYDQITEEEIHRTGDVEPSKLGEIVFKMPGTGLSLDGAFRIVIWLHSKGRWCQGPSCWLHSQYLASKNLTLEARQWDSHGTHLHKAIFQARWSVGLSFDFDDKARQSAAPASIEDSKNCLHRPSRYHFQT